MGGIRFGEREGTETVSTGVSSHSFHGVEAHVLHIPAFTIAYFLRILHSSDPPLEANLAYDAVQRALPAMQDVGFQSDLVGSGSLQRRLRSS